MIITKNSQNERLVQKVCELLKRSSTNLNFFFNYLKNLVTDIAPPPALRPGTTVPPAPPRYATGLITDRAINVDSL